MAALEVRPEGVPSAGPLLVLLPFPQRPAVAPLPVEDVQEVRGQVGVLEAAVAEHRLRGSLLIPREGRAQGEPVIGALRPRGRGALQPASMGPDATELG